MFLTLVLLVGYIATACVNGDPQSIYPDTLWCTYNKTSIDLNDDRLGPLAQEDSCCRHRNNCPWYILPGECKYNICNKYSYTLFHCACNKSFKLCLKEVGTEHARNIFWKFFIHSKCPKDLECSHPEECIEV